MLVPGRLNDVRAHLQKDIRGCCFIQPPSIQYRTDFRCEICVNTFVVSNWQRFVGQYFTFDEIIRFREFQAITGTIISGSTAVQFFERDVYTPSDLDLYVEHQAARPMTQWLESIGYSFVPQQDGEFQTLQMGLEKSADFKTADPLGISALTDGLEKGYFDAVAVLDFKKLSRPNIQVITSRGPPLQMVLNFHSSECCKH